MPRAGGSLLYPAHPPEGPPPPRRGACARPPRSGGPFAVRPPCRPRGPWGPALRKLPVAGRSLFSEARGGAEASGGDGLLPARPCTLRYTLRHTLCHPCAAVRRVQAPTGSRVQGERDAEGHTWHGTGQTQHGRHLPPRETEAQRTMSPKI